MTTFETLHATRYLVPLKEGGSLPAVVDTENYAAQPTGLFVVKFRGAGQGVKALIAELIVGGLAHQLGLQVPELCVVQLAKEFGSAERDPEIQDILRGSRGANVGLRYLEGAFNFDAAMAASVTSDFASRLVWFDALTFQIDRTARNPNLLLWSGEATEPTDGSSHGTDLVAGEPWLIDHGAALYPHHDWQSMTEERALDPFQFSTDHVLISHATTILDVDQALAPRALAVLDQVLEALPADLLSFLDERQSQTDEQDQRDRQSEADRQSNATEVREHYKKFLTARLAGQPNGERPFVTAAHRAHQVAQG